MLDYAAEFLRESRRIDQLIWDAMSLVHGERVLFCGFANDGLWVKRAIEIGVDVSVIESDAAKLAELETLGISTLRGSTTLIPARDNSFDAIVAFHYLHEIDPTFHTQIVWELARVGKRIIIVEPAPPADPLGKRISELYSRAKYEAGAFEEYRPIDYWRKLLAMVKADVLMQQFTFTRLAPRFAVEETVGLILDAMEVEQMPQGYLEELRELARRPEAQLSPLSRFVLVALGAGANRSAPLPARSFAKKPRRKWRNSKNAAPRSRPPPQQPSPRSGRLRPPPCRPSRRFRLPHRSRHHRPTPPQCPAPSFRRCYRRPGHRRSAPPQPAAAPRTGRPTTTRANAGLRDTRSGTVRHAATARGTPGATWDAVRPAGRSRSVRALARSGRTCRVRLELGTTRRAPRDSARRRALRLITIAQRLERNTRPEQERRQRIGRADDPVDVALTGRDQVKDRQLGIGSDPHHQPFAFAVHSP